MKKSIITLLTFSLVFIISCNKDNEESPDVPGVDIEFIVINKVDDVLLEMDQMDYMNAAGNNYEVTRIEYYIGDIAFKRSNGTWYRPFFEPVLINGEIQNQRFVLKNVQANNYVGFSFMVGLPENWNVTGKMENNIDNLNMAWPENLGGGYHFMKFEGNYLDDQKIIRGFTVHLGKNGMQSINEFPDLAMNVNSSMTEQVQLIMNLNEWFESPHLYDFNVDGNYTMAIDSLMKKVSENGENCFTINLQQ